MKRVLVGKRKVTAALNGKFTGYPPGFEGDMETESALYFARQGHLSILGDASEFNEDGEYIGGDSAEEATEEAQDDATETAEPGNQPGADGDGVVSPGATDSAGESDTPKPKAKRRVRTRKPATES